MTKTALITGASSGIGRATAEAFLADDWQVWATARNEADMAGLADSGAKTAELDVTNARECERVVETVVGAEGRIDCLVNNAGYGQYGPLEDVTTAQLHEQFDVNVYGPHRLTRAVLPHMRDREDGTIVNVSSVNGRIATPGAGAYAGSKFALEAMSDSLRAEVADFGVDVVLVEPGPVETNFADRAGEAMADTEASGAYGWLYELYEDTALVSENAVSVSPDAVAHAIRDAAVTTDPRPRYPVGQFARVATLASHLPGRWRDLAVAVLRKLV
ncbi:SDR family oxidoreductase [Halomicrobium katesii]|uniref:SDR family oxidoreductase n=1 Tax=Halomicrobium katesii TaxID=437163 RepID=UPI00036F1925|nr:SDR family oxidoreductase [Halomicrobium katesii]